MQFLDAGRVAQALPYDSLIDALDAAFRRQVTVPQRIHHTLEQASGTDASLLLMPAWRDGGAIGVKIVSVFPDNALRNRGSVNAVYCLLDGATGEPRAIIDGEELTLRRTACASALASRYLSRSDATSLLMIGSGKLAPHLVAAHAAVRSFGKISVWGRNTDKANALADLLAGDFRDVRPVTNLEAAVREADVVSCATLSPAPLIHGSWLRAGQHIDLVGAFTPQMREADGEALRRSRVFVDTRAGAFSEAGDIILAIAEGLFREDELAGELADLVSGRSSGRASAAEITLFKSVGTALEDLAAAELVVSTPTGPSAER
jgi:ornithine cyclodeaminase